MSWFESSFQNIGTVATSVTAIGVCVQTYRSYQKLELEITKLKKELEKHEKESSPIKPATLEDLKILEGMKSRNASLGRAARLCLPAIVLLASFSLYGAYQNHEYQLQVASVQEEAVRAVAKADESLAKAEATEQQLAETYKVLAKGMFAPTTEDFEKAFAMLNDLRKAYGEVPGVLYPDDGRPVIGGADVVPISPP